MSVSCDAESDTECLMYMVTYTHSVIKKHHGKRYGKYKSLRAFGGLAFAL